jgi:hypothetical protein
MSQEEEEVYSDIEGEDPYYPETERVLVTHTRSGRPVYTVKRLVVVDNAPEVEEGGGSQEEEEEEDESDDLETVSEEESEDSDSFITDDDSVDSQASFVPE